MAPPRRTKLPEPLPDGFVLTDTEKKRWRLGRILGHGGFGLIYLASQDASKPVAPDADFVIKVEYHENGPLFSELKFYQRAAKAESMQKWKRSRKLDFLGIPTYWGSGLAEYNGLRYRFMAMDRLGSDLQKVCDGNGGRLKKATVLRLGQVLVDVLEYIHENQYVHADIKAANLLLGYKDAGKIYLADYGLSYRYCPDGEHKEYKENPKKGHNGTMEYTSLDAHKGVAPSRRGDLQILGFCLLHWLCGSLPWDGFLKNPAQVQEGKARLMENLPDSVLQLSVSGASTDEVAELLSYVRCLDYQDKPDYQHLKDLLASGDKDRLDFSIPQGAVGERGTRATDPHSKDKQRVGRARGSSRAKPIADETTTLKTHLTEVPPHQKQKGIPLPVRRSPRPRPVPNYQEDESSDEPGPVPACYARGPPLGPRAQPKQKTKSNEPMRRDAEQPVACTEHRLHPGRRTQTGSGWEEADASRRHRSDSAGPTRGFGHRCFFMGLLLFLGALLALSGFLN